MLDKYLQSGVVMEVVLIFSLRRQGHGLIGVAGVVLTILGGPLIGASGWLMSNKNSGIIGTEKL